VDDVEYVDFSPSKELNTVLTHVKQKQKAEAREPSFQHACVDGGLPPTVQSGF
jgi:hypothetical protein